MDIPFSTWTIVLGHATFCIVVVYNNAVARFRRLSGSLVEASMDLGANGFQTFRHVILPNLGTALLAGGMLAFALSFDEVIVTTFTAGQQSTLPIWMLEELVRPRQRPVTNVVAMVVVLVTLLPILAAYYLTRGGEDVAGQRQMIVPMVRIDQVGTTSTARRTCMDTAAADRRRASRPATEAPEPILNPRTGATDPRAARGLAGAGRRRGRRGAAAPSTAWSRTTPAERSAALLRIADRIEAEADGFAALEALNCGKPINAVKNDEMPAIVDCWRFFAGAVRCQHGAARGRVPRRPHLDDPPRPGRRRRLDRALELPADDDGLEARPGARRRQHRGLQALRADAADRAEARRASSPRSCPPGVVNVVTGRGASVGSALINHPGVDMISLTGDVGTGQQDAARRPRRRSSAPISSSAARRR